MDLGTGERLETAAESQLEYVVGEFRIAREHGAMRVRPNDLSLLRPFGGVVAVADPPLDGAEWPRAVADPGEAAMVLEAGDERLRTVGLGPAVEDLADRSYVPAAGLDVEDAEARYDLVALADRERGATDLVAGADREHRRARIERPEQVAVLGELPYSGGLGEVLAATQQVDLAVRRQLLAGLDDHDARVDASPGEPLAEDGRVATVAVDAEQRLVHQHD